VALHRIILMAVLAAFASSAVAQSDIPTDIPIGLADTHRIETFANGDIRHSRSADIYFMVVQATDKAGQFWLQCERRGPFTVSVAMVGVTDRVQRSQQVSIRADDGPTRKLDLIVFQNFVAIAMRHEGRPDENTSVFMDMLQSAKQTFTIAYADESHNFDIRSLSAPRARFLALCRQQKS
jgi:hypothetical protein